MLVIAHVGHYTSLVLFVPVIGFMIWLAVTQFRERRAAAREAKVAANRDS